VWLIEDAVWQAEAGVAGFVAQSQTSKAAIHRSMSKTRVRIFSTFSSQVSRVALKFVTAEVQNVMNSGDYLNPGLLGLTSCNGIYYP